MGIQRRGSAKTLAIPDHLEVSCAKILEISSCRTCWRKYNEHITRGIEYEWRCQDGVGGNEERNSVKENICNYGIRESTMTPKHQTKNTQFTLMCSPLASNLECKSTVQNYSVTFKVKEIAKRRI